MHSASSYYPSAEPWQLIIKIAGAKLKKTKRIAYAYEAKNLQGEIMFSGVASCAASSAYGAALEALVEAALKARNMGFHRVIFLSSSKSIVQMSNRERAPNWQEKTVAVDLIFLHHNGLLR